MGRLILPTRFPISAFLSTELHQFRVTVPPSLLNQRSRVPHCQCQASNEHDWCIQKYCIDLMREEIPLLPIHQLHAAVDSPRYHARACDHQGRCNFSQGLIPCNLIYGAVDHVFE